MIYFFQCQFCLIALVSIFLGCKAKQLNVNSDIKNKPINEVISNIVKKDLLTDSDGDGIVNKFDLERNTPSGIAVDHSGRSLDSDSDGIPDYIDDDPFSTPGAHVDSNGRELDDDRDGVPNNQDLESNTKIGVLVNNMGQKINSFDDVFLPLIYFTLNNSDLEYFNLERLQVVASIMRSNLSFKLRIIGFLDSNSSEIYNENLDIKRAQSVFESLANIFGVDMERMVVFSKPSMAYSLVNKRCVQFELY